MGLPLFAGMIKQEKGKIIFTNHSGHYKPQTTVNEAKELLANFLPKEQSFNYEPVEDTEHFKETTRLDNISSPEDYVDKVNEFIYYPERAINYLKDEGVWEKIEKIK
ncbi:hypothetical protein D3C84_1112460 [compost metagenome]